MPRTPPRPAPDASPAAPRRPALRVVALIAVAGLVGTGLWSATRTKDGGAAAPRAGTAEPPRTGTKAPDWDPEGQAAPQPGPSPGPVAPLPPPPAIDDGGTPVADGTTVALDVAWRKSERDKHHYELVETEFHRDMATSAVLMARHTQRFTVEVLEADAEKAKLRFTIDSFRYQTYRADGFPLDFDTLAPDARMLDFADFAALLAPRRAIVGVPLELTVAQGGGVLGAQGLGEWRTRWADAIDRVTPGKGRDAQDLPRAGTFAATWTEILFPKIGTDAVVAGKGRDFRFDQPVPGKWRIAWKGRLDVARLDPDALRVDVVATPVAEEAESVVPDPSVVKVHAAGDGDAMRGKFRYSRKTGGIAEAQLDVRGQVWVSRPAGAGPSKPDAPGYAPAFWEIERHLILRRVSSE
ncbi:MAG: hypothetical protein HMLKMBBP_00758 [Planctomycetes bacterium]|nr:hypothetical protein [Planctomycetota bacterium]